MELTETEQTYIQAARQGDVEAFNQLVLLYQDTVYTAAYRILGEPDTASDIAQDTFITAFQKLEQFQGGNFRAWLTRIAINATYDELRRRKRRPADSLDDMVWEEDSNPYLTSSSPTPEAEAQRSELRSAIEDCFHQLTAEHRLVIVMADIQDYSYEEIATVAQVALGTVKSRISRARLYLRDCLRGKEELLPSGYRQKDRGI